MRGKVSTGADVRAASGAGVVGDEVNTTSTTGTGAIGAGTNATGTGTNGAKVVGDGVGNFVPPGGCVLFQYGSLGASTSLIRPACSDNQSGVGSWFRKS